jgi:hypothetical protein
MSLIGIKVKQAITSLTKIINFKINIDNLRQYCSLNNEYLYLIITKMMNFTGKYRCFQAENILAAGAIVEEVFDLSAMSDNLSVDFSSSRASVVACPAVERRVDLAGEFAHVVFVEDLGRICLASEAVFFVARLASHRVFCFCKKFDHSGSVSLFIFFANDGVTDSLDTQFKKYGIKL